MMTMAPTTVLPSKPAIEKPVTGAATSSPVAALGAVDAIGATDGATGLALGLGVACGVTLGDGAGVAEGVTVAWGVAEGCGVADATGEDELEPPLPPPPKPLLPPEDEPLVADCEYAAKFVKCFVQITRSPPTSILHAAPAAKAPIAILRLPVAQPLGFAGEL